MDEHAKEILTFISRHQTGASFYQLVRGFGFPGAPYDLQEVLSSFIDAKLVDLRQPEDGVNAKYMITESGSKLIEHGG